MFEGVSVSDLNILFYKFGSRVFFYKPHNYGGLTRFSFWRERETERQREGRNERVQRLKESL